MRASLVWFVASGALATASLLAVTLDLDTRFRAPIVLVFALACPGIALVRLTGVRPLTAQLSLGITLSATLAVLIPSALLYAHAWSPLTALVILVSITIAAAGFDVARRARFGSFSAARDSPVDDRGGVVVDPPESR